MGNMEIKVKLFEEVLLYKIDQFQFRDETKPISLDSIRSGLIDRASNIIPKFYSIHELKLSLILAEPIKERYGLLVKDIFIITFHGGNL